MFSESRLHFCIFAAISTFFKMVLNYIWIAFFLIAFVIAVVRLIFFGDVEVFPNIMNSTYETAKQGFEISLGLT